MQTFGQLLSKQKANFIARDRGAGKRVAGGRGEKAEIEKLLKSLLQAVRSINLG